MKVTAQTALARVLSSLKDENCENQRLVVDVFRYREDCVQVRVRKRVGRRLVDVGMWTVEPVE
jgi:hypothetical protein